MTSHEASLKALAAADRDDWDAEEYWSDLALELNRKEQDAQAASHTPRPQESYPDYGASQRVDLSVSARVDRNVARQEAAARSRDWDRAVREAE